VGGARGREKRRWRNLSEIAPRGLFLRSSLFAFFSFSYLQQQQRQKQNNKNKKQLDTDLLLRLLWLSSWGGNPRAADVPSWGSSFPWLRSLRVAGARWRPTAAHRVPSLRRVLGACPGVLRIDATALRVLVPLGGIGGGNNEEASEGGDDLFFNATEAQLLASSALHHGCIRELELDVAVRLNLDDAAEPPLPEEEEEEGEGEMEGPRRGVWESEEAATAMEIEGGEEESFSSSSSFSSLRLLPRSAIAADPSAAHTAAVDVAEVVLAARTPLRVRRLSLSTPPTATCCSSSTFSNSSTSTPLPLAGERAVLAARCLRLGRAAALGGELRTLTLDRLTPEEAAAAVAGALSCSGEERQKKGKLERIEFRGVGGGAPCSWSEGVAAAVAGALSSSSTTTTALREIVFEGDAGGRDPETRRRVEASVLRALGAEASKKVSVRFCEESAARRASGAAYAARAAASAAFAAANAAANAAAANAAAAAAAAARPQDVVAPPLPAAVAAV
jgi:hypothetical protein